MNLKEIKELIDLMNENELTEIEIEKENGKIRLKKGISQENIQVSVPGNSTKVAADSDKALSDVKEESKSVEEGAEKIVSPMVGVFYKSPAPDAEPFVEEGDEIKEGQVLCIIEAMKVMNEIKSEVSGTVVKVLVDNAKSVEYDQPLFLIKK